MEPKKYQEWKVEKTKKENPKKISLVRTVSIFESEAKDMNNDHFYTGLMYFEDKKENSSPDQPPADEAAKKAELWAKIETMGKGKPHHASGIAKLVKFIKDNENGE